MARLARCRPRSVGSPVALDDRLTAVTEDLELQDVGELVTADRRYPPSRR